MRSEKTLRRLDDTYVPHAHTVIHLYTFDLDFLSRTATLQLDIIHTYVTNYVMISEFCFCASKRCFEQGRPESGEAWSRWAKQGHAIHHLAGALNGKAGSEVPTQVEVVR